MIFEVTRSVRRTIRRDRAPARRSPHTEITPVTYGLLASAAVAAVAASTAIEWANRTLSGRPPVPQFRHG